jgi:hypothetical protein
VLVQLMSRLAIKVWKRRVPGQSFLSAGVPRMIRGWNLSALSLIGSMTNGCWPFAALASTTSNTTAQGT